MGTVVLSMNLTTMAAFKVGRNVCVYAQPVVALKETFFCFVASQEGSVGVHEYIGDEAGW